MSATLDALQVLQQVTLKLTALQAKIRQKKRSVRIHEKRMVQRESELAAEHQTSMERQSAMSQVELEVKTRDAEIAKLREALNKAKTNKEYAAILTQINTGKADNSKLEDRVLEMMGELDRLKGHEEELRTIIQKERDSLQTATKVAEAFEQDSLTELHALEAERADAASSVPIETLSIFERVADRHEGEALARVIRPHPKREEFICDGCNMGVTLEQYAVLQARNEIQVCHNCGRVLFLDEYAT